MKNALYYCLVIFLILFFSYILSASEYRFSKLSMENGLSNNSVFKILQDSRGFMWFGTFSGLNRYDGKNFTVFKPEARFPNSISSSVIFDLFEDSKGNLWIGTDGGGLNRYDYKSNQFFHYNKQKNNRSGITSDQVYAINEDKQGRIWIGTDGGGISVFNPQSNSFSSYSADNPKSGLRSNTIRCIFRDSKDRMWIGTEGGGLSCFDDRNDKFITYQHNSKDAESLSSDVVRTIYEDRSGTLWIGTEGGGLLRYYETEKFVRIPLADAKSVRTINEDEYGRLWIGTEGKGVFVFSPDRIKFQQIKNSQYNPESLSYDKIRSIYIDRLGIIWIGTRGGGINKYNSKAKYFYHFNDNHSKGLSLTSNNINQIYEDSQQKIWVCTDGGGVNFIKNRTILGSLKNSAGNPNSLNSNHVFAVVEDKDGFIWLGTEGGGLNRYHPETGNFKHFLHNPQDPDTISSNVVWSLFEDSKGMLWIGTEGGGLNRYNKETGTFFHYQYDPDNSASLIGSSVHTIFEDSHNRLWIGTWDGGVSLYQEDDTFIRFRRDPRDPNSLSDVSINCIFEDSNQRIWIGTAGGGLNLYHEENRTFTHFTSSDGLAGDNVFGILEDDHKNLWISTDNGLSKVYADLKTFITYTEEDGLQKNEFTYNAFCKASTGEFFFGGTNGISSFFPDAIVEDAYTSNIVLTSIELLDSGKKKNEKLFQNPFVKLWPTQINQLELPPKNLLTIKFALLDYTAPDRNKYSVLLDNYHTEWLYIDRQNYITYSNIPPGNYLFRVKGANSKGIWSEIKEPLKVKVHPEFYQTYWFYLLVIICCISLIFIIYKLRTRSLKKQNQILKEYAYHIVQAREKERTSVAREVHDELGQILTVLKMDLFWLYNHLDQQKDVLSEKINNTLDLANVSLESIKRLSAKLRPNVLDNLSLSKAVKWLVDDFSRHSTDLLYSVEFNGDIYTIDIETKTSIFRILQELLTNTIRHSNASEVKVVLTYKKTEIVMQVTDNGIGINKENINSHTSFGIIGIKERCNSISAKLSFAHGAQNGTIVTVLIPYQQK
ncbi:MAG: histidine kinase [Spirochaetes bacterium]|nr:histidine kinase [Spirochaetota bacterium]